MSMTYRKTITPEELEVAIKKHRRWLLNKGGKCLEVKDQNLSGYDLSYSNLSYSDLSGTHLRSANLIGTNLNGANFGDFGIYIAHAAVYGSLHGKCGRQLLAIKCSNDTVFFCGCFKGTEKELRAYIRNDNQLYKKSRLTALKAVKLLLNIKELVP